MNETLAILITIALGLIAIAVIAASFGIFILVRQARQTLGRADSAIRSTEAELHLTLQELRESARNMNEFSGWLHKKKDNLSGAVEALEGFGTTLRNTSDIIRTTLHPRLLSFGALIVGLRTGSWYLLRRIFLKRR